MQSCFAGQVLKYKQLLAAYDLTKADIVKEFVGVGGASRRGRVCASMTLEALSTLTAFPSERTASYIIELNAAVRNGRSIASVGRVGLQSL